MAGDKSKKEEMEPCRKYRKRRPVATMYDMVDWPSHGHFSDSLWKFFSLQNRKGCNKPIEKSESREEACSCISQTKTARRRRLRSRSGFYLAIMPNGQVLGLKDPTNPYINLDVIPFGADLVKIWGVEAELFLMIDDAGLLRATDVDSNESIFEETLTEDFCNMYYSAMYSHKRWCVGLKTRPLSSFSGAFRRNKMSLRDCCFIAEVVHRRSSMSSYQSSYGSDDRISIL